MTDVVHDVNIKGKVNSVREVVSARSNNEIVLVLQYYDYDVEKTIQAYLEDGAKKAVTEWQCSGNKLLKKRKNKRKGNQSQHQTADIPQSPGSVVNDSLSTSGLLTDGEFIMNGSLHHDRDFTEAVKFIKNGPTTTATYLLTDTCSKEQSLADHSTHPVITSTIVPSDTESVICKNTNNVTLQANGSLIQSQFKKPEESDTKSEVKTTIINKETFPSSPHQHQNYARQRTHSGSHHHEVGRDHTMSSSSVDSKLGKKPTHGGLERSLKDLHRQTVSLERLRLVFNEEVDKSHKRIKSVFDEIRRCLNAREVQLLGEMEHAESVGKETFMMRQSLAAELKMKIDKAERMNETELTDLRNEIKHFVSDRKIDEDLARTTRFLYDSDKMKLEVAAFCEVVPVKCTYIQRRQSVSSVESTIVLSELDHHEHVPITTSLNAPNPTADDKDSKPSIPHIPHLDSNETHEVVEIQRRLKHSLVLEGIAVETYPERLESAPVVAATESASTSSSNTSRSATARRNQNRPWTGDHGDRGQRGSAREDQRVSFNQSSNGERVILIGRKTGLQGSRPPRGEGGQRSRSHRVGGITSNVPMRANSEETKGSNSTGENGDKNDVKNATRDSSSQSHNVNTIRPLAQREISGSSRRGGRPHSNRSYYANVHSDGIHIEPAGSGNYSNNTSDTKLLDHEQGATVGN